MNTDFVPVEEIGDGDDGRVYTETGPLTGRTRELHTNGNVAAIISYRNGIEDGPQHAYWPDGRIQSEGAKKIDWPVGTWREWYENGQLKSETIYESGVRAPVSRRTWSEDGTETTAGA